MSDRIHAGESTVNAQGATACESSTSHIALRQSTSPRMQRGYDQAYPYAKIIILFQGYTEEQRYIRLLRAVWRDGHPLPHPMGYERW